MSHKNKKNSEDSNLKTIKEIAKEKSLDIEKSLRKELAEKDAEIARLNRKIDNLTKVDKIQLNDEEMIAIIQLKKLRQVAQTRELTLEESRKFEIFSKIKNSVEKPKSLDASFNKLPAGIETSSLLSIANGQKPKK